ncbi:MAG: type II toxin-antitoxin system VapC family toxin [Armatimonadetes bacterium]|nr:type II toxin-antitoxin system VapC family toxin [Armatimonadota bacterium]
MAYLLDTGILIHAARKSTAFQAIDGALGLVQGGFLPVVSVVSVGEVEAFSVKSKWGTAKRQALAHFVRNLTVVAVLPGPLASRYAELEVINTSQGLNVGQNDLWIASTTIELDMTLLTFDGDFGRLPPPLQFIQFDPSTGAVINRRP